MPAIHIAKWLKTLGLAVLTVVGVVAVGTLALWTVPRLATHHKAGTLSPADVLKSVNDVRAPVVAFLVAVGAAGTLWFTGRTYLLNRNTQVATMYNTAVDHLAKDTSAAVRLGGVYALERIASYSAYDRQAVLNVLGDFIRERSNELNSATEVGRALDVAGRLLADSRDAELDLRGADLTDVTNKVKALPSGQVRLDP